MSEPYGGGAPSGDESRLDGLVGGPAALSADSLLMPPPPPRMRKPLQASLNPLLMGATVISASGPSSRRLNVRCVVCVEQGRPRKRRKRRKEGSLKILPRNRKTENRKEKKNRATQLRPQPRLSFFHHQSNRPRLWPSAAGEARSLSRKDTRRSSGFEGPGSGKVS